MVESRRIKLELDTYVGVYLKEEIKAEALPRSIENCSRVLNFASHINTEQVIFH